MAPGAGRTTRFLLGVAAVCMTAALALATPAHAACGETHQATPQQPPTNPPPLAIGDSVLADTVPLLAAAGYEANGMVCRTVDQGLAILQARANQLPSLVVFALGTNGGITDSQVREALSIVGPNRRLVLVTPHNGDDPNSAALARAAAAHYAPQTALLDWDRLSSPHPEWFASDGIHLGGQAGIHAYAQMIISALPYAQQQGVQAIPAPPPPPSAASGPVRPHVSAIVAARRAAARAARHVKRVAAPLPAIVLPPKPAPQPGSSRMWIVLAGAGAALLIAVLAGGLWLSRRRRRAARAGAAAPVPAPAPVVEPIPAPAAVVPPRPVLAPAAPPAEVRRRRAGPPRKLLLGGAAMIALALAAARTGLDRGRR